MHKCLRAQIKVLFPLEWFLKRCLQERSIRLTHSELLLSFLWGSQAWGWLVHWKPAQERRWKDKRACIWKSSMYTMKWGVHAWSFASNPRTSQPSSPLKSTKYHKRTRELLNSCSFASTECHCIILKLQSDSLKKKWASIFSIIQNDFFQCFLVSLFCFPFGNLVFKIFMWFPQQPLEGKLLLKKVIF